MLVVMMPMGLRLARAAEGQVAGSGNGIEGQWQGSVPGPRGDQRMVVQIKGDSGALSATVIMLDMGGPMGLPRFAASDVSFSGIELKFSLTFMGSSFDGKMSSNRNTIEGTWSGQQGSQRVVLARATPDTAWALPQSRPRMKPMAANADPGIEVSTIKPSKAGERMMFRVGGDLLVISNVALENLIRFAYDVEPRQIVNGPSWISSEMYDVEVKPDQPGAPSKDQWNSILRKLLADRFQLRFHTDQKMLPAYILKVAKSGPKMTKVAIEKTDGAGGPESTRMRPGSIDAQALSMADFAHSLRSIFDRPVVDQTGLTGVWTFSLRWTPDEMQAGMAMRGPMPSSDDAADAPPPLFTAVQEQLGLKLESGKAQVPVFVIDNVAKPSAN